MAKKIQEPEPEPELRDLPEPKDEPSLVVFADPVIVGTTKRSEEATTKAAPPFPEVNPTNLELCVDEHTSFADGIPMSCSLVYLDRGGRPAYQHFRIIASKGPEKPEVRVIGASNVTVG